MGSERTGVTVLLVEDDPGDARLLRDALSGAVLVGHVGSLGDAVAWLDANRADVVLLDLGLPDSIGLATLEALLATHPSTPVVVLSGSDDDERASAAVEAGAQEYLVKGSVDTQVMRRILRHAVERHRLQSQLRERAKEIAGLYAITHELQGDRNLDDAVEAIATRLRDAMQWPAVCRVTAAIDESTATVGPAGGGDLPRLTATIERSGGVRGRLTVRYVEDRPFLEPHEQELLEAAADTIGVWLDRQDSVHRLRRSSEQLRVLVSQLPGLLWTTDTELRITSYGGGRLAELDIDPGALVGSSLADLLESDPPEQTMDLFQQALAGTPATFERRWRGRWFRNHLEPKTRDDGEVDGVVCLSLDVTEEKAHAVELAATRAHLEGSEQRFRTMAEAAQDAIYRIRTEPEPTFEYLNPAVEAVSGFGIEDFLDNPYLYLQRAHPEDAHLLDPTRLDPARTETVTVRFQHADGHWVWLEDSRTPIVEDGATVGVQGVIRDVTSRRRTQQALQDALEVERRASEQLRSADRLKGHFLQAVSHELRTPLTAVLGLSATLVEQEHRLSQEQVGYFHERILANARKLDGLLRDLLDLDRLQHDVARIDRRPVDLTALVARVAAEVELGGRGLTLEQQPVVADVDPERVERIVHNLLANAVKHTPPGTHIRVGCTTDSGGAEIEVADDGPGVPDELAIAVFEPFRQGPQAYGAASPGTGIGLSIVSEMAALHGGTAWVRPTPGGGATFTVRLPSQATNPDATVDTDDGGTPVPALVRAAASPTSADDEIDAAAVMAWATGQLSTAGSREELLTVLIQTAHALGGWVVPARAADEEDALPLDISFGTGEPLLPAAVPASPSRLLIERHLPRLVAEARAVADALVDQPPIREHHR